jgi:hypothetical protein
MSDDLYPTIAVTLYLTDPAVTAVFLDTLVVYVHEPHEAIELIRRVAPNVHRAVAHLYVDDALRVFSEETERRTMGRYPHVAGEGRLRFTPCPAEECVDVEVER